MRGNVVSVLGEDFALVARAKGLPTGRPKWGHALRNALLPFVAHLAAHASITITGTVFIETLFNCPGTGRLISEAVGARDYPVIQADVHRLPFPIPLTKPVSGCIMGV